MLFSSISLPPSDLNELLRACTLISANTWPLMTLDFILSTNISLYSWSSSTSCTCPHLHTDLKYSIVCIDGTVCLLLDISVCPCAVVLHSCHISASPLEFLTSMLLVSVVVHAAAVSAYLLTDCVWTTVSGDSRASPLR